MTNEEVAVKLTKHHEEIGSLKHRVDELEDKNTVIQDIALSVRELAVNMKSMLKEQERQGEAITVLQARPAKRWDTVITSTISAVIGGLIGIAIAQLF